jgi:hypothetical protein
MDTDSPARVVAASGERLKTLWRIGMALAEGLASRGPKLAA